MCGGASPSVAHAFRCNIPHLVGHTFYPGHWRCRTVAEPSECGLQRCNLAAGATKLMIISRSLSTGSTASNRETSTLLYFISRRRVSRCRALFECRPSRSIESPEPLGNKRGEKSITADPESGPFPEAGWDRDTDAFGQVVDYVSGGG